jgi:hypothetical protein
MPMSFSRWKSPDPAFDAILKAWALSSDLHVYKPPAPKQLLSMTVAKVGRNLPHELMDLYGFSNGMKLFSNNLNLDPLVGAGGRPGLVDHSALLKEHEWQVPPELVIFGDTGEETFFGVWCPKRPGGKMPVVEIGAVFDDPKCLAVHGTNFLRFLKARTALYLMKASEDLPTEALEALGVPGPLRTPEPDEAVTKLLYRWADPEIPDPLPDPMARGMDAAALRKMYGGD